MMKSDQSEHSQAASKSTLKVNVLIPQVSPLVASTQNTAPNTPPPTEQKSAPVMTPLQKLALPPGTPIAPLQKLVLPPGTPLAASAQSAVPSTPPPTEQKSAPVTTPLQKLALPPGTPIAPLQKLALPPGTPIAPLQKLVLPPGTPLAASAQSTVPNTPPSTDQKSAPVTTPLQKLTLPPGTPIVPLQKLVLPSSTPIAVRAQSAVPSTPPPTDQKSVLSTPLQEVVSSQVTPITMRTQSAVPNTPPPSDHKGELDTPSSTIKAAAHNEKESLDGKTKKLVVDKLEKMVANDLNRFLIQAVLDNEVFPESLSTFSSLQESYRKTKHLESTRLIMEQAVQSYIDAEGVRVFQELLRKQPFQANAWPSGILIYLANALKIDVEQKPMVEAAIFEGKVYWRVVKGDSVVYDRPASKGQTFNFDLHKKIRMTWEQFRKFKDSGKKTGTVEITQQRFMDTVVTKCGTQYQMAAALLWNELKEKGVLNARNRLSEGWRLLSNKVLSLSNRSFQQQLIVNILYEIANNTNFKEIIDGVPDAEIFRYERSLKEWCNTDRVNNNKTIFTQEKNVWGQRRLYSKAGMQAPAEIQQVSKQSFCYSNQLWTVSTHKDLIAFHNKDYEEEKFGHEFHHDHIPSGAILKDYLKGQIAMIGNLLIQNEQKIYQRLSVLYGVQYAYMTQQLESFINGSPDPEVKSLNAERQELVTQKAKLESKVKNKNIDAEWLCMAMPRCLHQEGATYQQQLLAQHSAIGNEPFLKEVIAYLDILEARWKEFVPSQDEYLAALGAFRYFYRQLIKPVSLIGGMLSRDDTPYNFFQTKKDLLPKLDALFHERLGRYLNIKEGLNQNEKVARKLNVDASITSAITYSV